MLGMCCAVAAALSSIPFCVVGKVHDVPQVNLSAVLTWICTLKPTVMHHATDQKML
jgi:hypothetical protein